MTFLPERISMSSFQRIAAMFLVRSLGFTFIGIFFYRASHIYVNVPFHYPSFILVKLQEKSVITSGPDQGPSCLQRLTALSQTGSSLARTNLSPFARCTLGLSRHFYKKNILCDHCLHDSGLYIQKILTKREMIYCQKSNFLLFLTIYSVTTVVRELNETSQISLVTHDAKGEMREI